MRICKMLVGFGIGAALIAAGGAAQAAAAPCAPGTPATLRIKAPSTLAYGRAASASLKDVWQPGTSGLWKYQTENGKPLSPVRWSFSPAEPGKALAHAFSYSKSNLEFEPRLLFRRRDGAGVITATWVQAREESLGFGQWAVVEECEMSVSQQITPIRGELASVEAEARAGLWPFRLIVACPSQGKEYGERIFRQTSSAPVHVQIAGAHQRKVVDLGDPCKERFVGRVKTHRWEAEALNWITGIRGGPRQAVSVGPTGITARPTRMRLRVMQAGVVIASGRFKLREWETHLRVVHEGTDAFVNFCIDQNRVIHSSNGRLYCSSGGKWRTLAFDLHWSLSRRT